jgi:hypothetical protein
LLDLDDHMDAQMGRGFPGQRADDVDPELTGSHLDGCHEVTGTEPARGRQ